MLRQPSIDSDKPLLSSLQRILMAGALVGATALSLGGGTARAANPYCTFQASTGGFPACSDPNLAPTTVGDKTLTIINGPTAGTGDVEFLVGGDYWQVDTDFTPSLTNNAGTFDYKISINDPNKFFDKIINSWTGTPGTDNKKGLYKASGFGSSDLIFEMTGSSNEEYDISSLGLKDLWVRDAYSSPAGGQLDSVVNFYSQTVPGPLPLLGAGTAFGFSRRLRRRLKQRLSLV